MSKFQLTVVTTAAVILIICLVALGVLIYYSSNNDKWPPDVGDCPDYFLMKNRDKTEDGSPFHGGEQCYNEHSLGNQKSFSVDNGACTWYNSHDKTNKEKKKWARGCGLTWDGITNI